MTYSELLAEIPVAYLATVAALFGLNIGSFLNVAIYRLPLHVSVAKPRSFCPHCKATIQWYRNIPVVAYIMLGGRCGKCKEPISIRYPLVELAVAFIFGASVWRWGLAWSSLSASRKNPGESISYASASNATVTRSSPAPQETKALAY
jgi:hypothetical protein